MNTDCTRTVDVATVYERTLQTSMFLQRHVAFFARDEAGRS